MSEPLNTEPAIRAMLSDATAVPNAKRWLPTTGAPAGIDARYARLAEAARRVVEAGKHPCFCGGDEEYATGEEPHLPFCPVGLAIRALAEALGDGR